MELFFSYHISGKTAINPSTPVKSFKIKIEVYVSALLPDRRRETSNQVKKKKTHSPLALQLHNVGERGNFINAYTILLYYVNLFNNM